MEMWKVEYTKAVLGIWIFAGVDILPQAALAVEIGYERESKGRMHVGAMSINHCETATSTAEAEARNKAKCGPSKECGRAAKACPPGERPGPCIYSEPRNITVSCQPTIEECKGKEPPPNDLVITCKAKFDCSVTVECYPVETSSEGASSGRKAKSNMQGQREHPKRPTSGIEQVEPR